MFPEDQTENILSYQNSPLPPDFFGLPNLLPASGYKQHRRSRSGIEMRHQPDLTHDIDLSVLHHVYIYFLMFPYNIISFVNLISKIVL